MPWQPIETAPHDRDVLLWRPARAQGFRPHGAVRGRWIARHRYSNASPWVTVPGLNGMTVTHWQPLPEPP